jgi:LacI family transcriptional regulator
MSEQKEITIYDIATRLKLSPTTVSRALNNNPAISKATRQLVNELATQLGYRSNTFASSLRTKKTNTIGVIVQRLNSNFLASVLSGMENVANKEGYNLIISQSLEHAEKEKENVINMFNNRVDGLLASLSYDTEDTSHFDAFIKKGLPVVFFDRVGSNENCLNIIIDNYKNGYEVTKHLIDQGCKNILHVTGNLKRNVYAERYRGFRDALKDADLKFNDNMLVVNELTDQDGITVAESILSKSKRPDGLFVTNDTCAVFCMKTLKKAGIKVPKDIAIAGFNNDPIGQVAEPNLTTINYPGQVMGEVAAAHLIAHLNGKYDIKTTNTIVIRSELIVRESSIRK